MDPPISDIYRYAFRYYLDTQSESRDGWAAENNFIAIYKRLLRDTDPFPRKDELILFMESFKKLTAFQQGMRRYYLGLGLTSYKNNHQLHKKQHRFENIMKAVHKDIRFENAQKELNLKYPLKNMPFYYLRKDFITIISILVGHEEAMRRAVQDARMMLIYYIKRTCLHEINLETTDLRKDIQFNYIPSGAIDFVKVLLYHGY